MLSLTLSNNVMDVLNKLMYIKIQVLFCFVLFVSPVLRRRLYVKVYEGCSDVPKVVTLSFQKSMYVSFGSCRS